MVAHDAANELGLRNGPIGQRLAAGSRKDACVGVDRSAETRRAILARKSAAAGVTRGGQCRGEQNEQA